MKPIDMLLRPSSLGSVFYSHNRRNSFLPAVCGEFDFVCIRVAYQVHEGICPKLMAVVLFPALSLLPGQEPLLTEYHNALKEAEKLFADGELEQVIRKLSPWAENTPTGPRRIAVSGSPTTSSRTLPEPSGTCRRAQARGGWFGAVETDSRDSGHGVLLQITALRTRPAVEKATQWSKDNTNLLYTLAMSYLYTRDRDNARRMFAQLFGVAPESPQAFFLAAELMVQENYSADAEFLLQEASKRRPDLPRSTTGWDSLRLPRANTQKRCSTWKKELAANPSHSLAWHYLGDAYVRLGKIDRAIDPLQRALWLNRNASRSYVLLANVYAQKGRFFVAENSLKRALHIDPHSYEAHFLLARIYHKTNRPDLAREEMARAEKLRAQNETRK